MKLYAGIDIGSTSTKVVLINDQDEIVAFSVAPSGSLFHKNAVDQYEGLLLRNSFEKSQVQYLVSTGYGRKLYKNADDHINEITANASGIHFINKPGQIINTIINIGGQDSKIISIDENAHVKQFAMNDKCAAGTGKFLEMAARTLEVGVDELEDLHFQAGEDIATVNATCAVFAESEIISLLASGTKKSSIVAGIHFSIAKRVLRLASQIEIKSGILFDGGTALNGGLRQALEEELMNEIIISKHPEITSAAGAALIGKQKI